MPAISRRASELGTENAFVVLAEVSALQRQGKDIISFCIGQPDFPTPKNIREAGIKAIESLQGASDERIQQKALALEHARYEVTRTRRQYDAVDPANRLVAAELKRRWNFAENAL